MSTETRKLILVAYLVMACGLLASCGSDDSRPDPLAAYKGQMLEWQACSGNQIFREALGESNVELVKKLGDRAKCTLMRAPLNYDDPAKGDVQVAFLRVGAGDPQQRLGAIMFNPGGPGGMGCICRSLSTPCGPVRMSTTLLEISTDKCPSATI